MTKPGCSLFNNPDGNDAMNDDLQELLPWIRENWRNAAKLWCAFSNIEWMKGEIEFSLTFRGAGAYVGELFMGTEKYLQDNMNYLEFYCSGSDGAVDPHIFEHLTKCGWKPCRYGGHGDQRIWITEAREPIINERDNEPAPEGT